MKQENVQKKMEGRKREIRERSTQIEKAGEKDKKQEYKLRKKEIRYENGKKGVRGENLIQLINSFACSIVPIT